MTEPDFDQIARTILEASDGEPGETRIVEALRQVWNARGAADIADLEDALNGETFVDDLTTRLKALDR